MDHRSRPLWAVGTRALAAPSAGPGERVSAFASKAALAFVFAAGTTNNLKMAKLTAQGRRRAPSWPKQPATDARPASNPRKYTMRSTFEQAMMRYAAREPRGGGNEASFYSRLSSGAPRVAM